MPNSSDKHSTIGCTNTKISRPANICIEPEKEVRGPVVIAVTDLLGTLNKEEDMKEARAKTEARTAMIDQYFAGDPSITPSQEIEDNIRRSLIKNPDLRMRLIRSNFPGTHTVKNTCVGPDRNGRQDCPTAVEINFTSLEIAAYS